MKALVIVDMQEDYIGKNAKYNFSNKKELIEKINIRINEYKEKGNKIIYVKNNRKNNFSNFVTGLNIESNLIFEKISSSCYSSTEFCDCLKSNNISEIEIAGIDGNCCVKSTAIDAVKNNIKATVPIDLVGVINTTRFSKTIEKFKEKNVKIEL